MKRAAYAYIRVSGKGQLEGHGFDRQEETVRAYCKSAGVTVAGVYREAHTGTEANRPAFQEMLLAILSNGVRTVVVESLDRLARDLMVQTQLLATLRARGVSLIAASTGEDVTAALDEDPMRRAMVQVQGTFAELDKRLLVRKLRKARDAKRAAEGRCEGRKPFGDRPGEQETLDLIVSLRKGAKGQERLSFERIAATLNERNIPSRTGKPWAPATVFGIVRRTAPKLTAAR